MQKATPPPRKVTQSTEEFAREIGIKAASVRKRLSATGSYYGVRPVKLANRRLRWPVNALLHRTEVQDG